MDPWALFLARPELCAEKAALLLALTATREEEDSFRVALEEHGQYRAAVTELGAKLASFREKLYSAALGTALAHGVITKTPEQVHALLHAAREAAGGLLPDSVLQADVAVKISVVRGGRWLAVAIFGDLAEHPAVDHKCAGLGVMHLPI